MMTHSSLMAGMSIGADSSIMLKDTKAKDKKSDDKNKNDNKDDENDNEDGGGEDSCSSNGDSNASAMTPATTPTGALPTTEVTGTSNGGDSTVKLIDERVVLQIFPWMPSGITFKVR